MEVLELFLEQQPQPMFSSPTFGKVQCLALLYRTNKNLRAPTTPEKLADSAKCSSCKIGFAFEHRQSGTQQGAALQTPSINWRRLFHNHCHAENGQRMHSVPPVYTYTAKPESTSIRIIDLQSHPEIDLNTSDLQLLFGFQLCLLLLFPLHLDSLAPI